MSNYAIVVDVMLGVYLVNFINAFLNGALSTLPKARVWIDVLIGVILLFLVLGT